MPLPSISNEKYTKNPYSRQIPTQIYTIPDKNSITQPPPIMSHAPPRPIVPPLSHQSLLIVPTPSPIILYNFPINMIHHALNPR